MFRAYRTIVGAVVGLLVGLLLTLFVNYAATPQLSLANLGGAVWVLLAGALIGVAYALLFEPLPRHYVENGSTGLVLGIILWIVWAISLQPALVGNWQSWGADVVVASLPKLISYLILGGGIGLLYSVVYEFGAQSLGLLPPVVGETAVSQHIIIIGGGYAGVTAAQILDKQLATDPAVRVTLISNTNFLIHTPMLSEVSASAVNAQNISPPLRSFFNNVQVIQSDIASFNLTAKTVTLTPDQRGNQKTLPFNELIITAGGVPNFFGNQAIEKEAFTFKTLDDAIRIRNQIIQMFEQADLEPDPARRQQLLTFCVAGGGFAGVELLGGINDFARGISFYYPNINPKDIRTVLVHSRERILPELSEELGEFAREKLAQRGVEFKLGVRVTGARHGVVEIGDEEIPSHTFIWTAGNQPSPVLKRLGIPLTKRGQIEVNTELQAVHAPHVWAAGDCAQVPDLTTGNFAPPTAQHAVREGKVVGYNVAATLKGKKLKQFKFKALGSLAALGHQLAVAEIFGRRFSGFLAWLMWRGIYLSKLPTFQKQVRVLLDWILDIFFPPDIVQTIQVSERDVDV